MVRWLLALIVGFILSLPMPCRAATSYSAMTGHLADLTQRSKLIKLYDLGKASSGDRSVWLVSVSDPATDIRKTTRVLILCRQHGDEPVNTEAAIEFLDHVADGTAPGAQEALRHTTLFIVPMVNPDGADALQRLNARGIDLNRDWGKFRAVETLLVNDARRAIRPAFVLDMHSWDPQDPFTSNSIEAPQSRDAVSACARDLQRRATTEVSDGTGQNIAEVTYHAGVEESLCHRYMTDWAHTPSLLFETASGPDNGPGFDHRIALSRAMFLWLLRDTAAHPEAWSHMETASRCDLVRPTLTLGTAWKDPALTPIPAYDATLGAKGARSHLHAMPLSLLWGLAAYAVVAACVAKLRPTARELGYIHIQHVTSRADGTQVLRAVYVDNGTYKRPELTPVQRRG